MNMCSAEDIRLKAKNTRIVLFDVDGVLTDGGLILGDGGEHKIFDVKDGMGMTLARRGGLKTGILTGRTSMAVKKRGEELGMDLVIQGTGLSKLEPLKEALHSIGIPLEHVAYMGDDLQDLSVLTQAGFAAAPADARPEVRCRVDLVTQASGGKGAAREMIEFILQAQGQWQGLVESFLV